MSERPLPRLAEHPAFAAWLLGARAGRDLPAAAIAALEADARSGDGLVEYLASRRLAAEAIASPRIGRSRLPASVRRRLAVERERIRAGSVVRRRTLETCGEAFERAGIAALLYKGAAVVELTHGDASRRPMTDLDVVVRAADRAAAREALVRQGLSSTPFDTRLHDVLVDTRQRGPGIARGIAVELHADVFPPPHPFALDLEEVFASATPGGVRGLLLPSRAHAILLAAFHLALYENDGGKGLLTLRDVALLAATADDAGGRHRATIAACAERWEMQAVLREVGRRAVAWAGGPGWLEEPCPAAQSTTMRRRAALRLALDELDATVASTAVPPPARALSRRLSAALWPRGVSACASAIWTGIAGGHAGAGGVRRAARVIARHAAALARSHVPGGRAAP